MGKPVFWLVNADQMFAISYGEPERRHKWLGDDRDTYLMREPKINILCYKYADENPHMVTWFYVTDSNEHVTCKDCLELIHS